MRYYRDKAGVYLGGWDQYPPAGAVEVPSPPDDARQVWGGSDWLPYNPVPAQATKLALYERLHNSGDWPQIEAALSVDQHAYNSWMFAQVIDRNHPLIEQFRVLLGWTVEQVDDLFRAAQ